jgi:hypothetical protein
VPPATDDRDGRPGQTDDNRAVGEDGKKLSSLRIGLPNDPDAVTGRCPATGVDGASVRAERRGACRGSASQGAARTWRLVHAAIAGECRILTEVKTSVSLLGPVGQLTPPVETSVIVTNPRTYSNPSNSLLDVENFGWKAEH